MNTNRFAAKSLAIAAVFASGLVSLGATASAQTAPAAPTAQVSAPNVAPAKAAADAKLASAGQVAFTANHTTVQQDALKKQAAADAENLAWSRYQVYRHLNIGW